MNKVALILSLDYELFGDGTGLVLRKIDHLMKEENR